MRTLCLMLARCTAFLLAALGALGCGGGAHARAVDESNPLRLYWMATSNEADSRRTGVRYHDLLTFGDLPVQRDAVVLYEHWYALDVRTEGLSLTQTDPNYWVTFDETMQRVLDRYVPDVNFSGLLLIDTEFLPLFWGDRTAGPGIYPESDYGRRPFDDWYTHIRNTRPELLANLGTTQTEEVLKSTYEGAVRTWTERQYATVRRLRPQARLCRYGLPAGSRHWQYNTPDPNFHRQQNDSAAWLTALQDVVLVVLYQDKFTVPEGVTPRHNREMTPAQARDWIFSNTREARRTAQGKPVYALAYLRYQEFVTGHESQILDATALDTMLRLPIEAGCDSIVLWDHIDSQNQLIETQNYINSRVLSMLAEVLPTQSRGGNGSSGNTNPGDTGNGTNPGDTGNNTGTNTGNNTGTNTGSGTNPGGPSSGSGSNDNSSGTEPNSGGTTTPPPDTSGTNPGGTTGNNNGTNPGGTTQTPPEILPPPPPPEIRPPPPAPPRLSPTRRMGLTVSANRPTTRQVAPKTTRIARPAARAATTRATGLRTIRPGTPPRVLPPTPRPGPNG
jgi:hypothetical protein